MNAEQIIDAVLALDEDDRYDVMIAVAEKMPIKHEADFPDHRRALVDRLTEIQIYSQIAENPDD